MTGLLIALAVVAVATGFGLLRGRREGSFQGHVDGVVDEVPAPVNVLAGTSYEQHLGPRASLVQFSSAFCQPCRATRVILTDVVGVVPDVAHVEIDAEQELELVRRLAIQRTPTTLILDQDGRELARATGAPNKEQVLSALARHLGR